MLCFICNVDKSESDSASGTVFCTNCGIVLEESTLISEVSFEETEGGRSTVQGTLVGASGRITGRPNFGGRGRRRRQEAPEQSLDNARRYIHRLAHALKLNESHCESAVRYYKLAVVNGFTKGRDPKHVAAVCLYAACRDAKSPTMLIDLSDVLQINVFTLGSTFLKFLHKVNVNLPLVDPCLYISRFAAALDFGEYTHRVAQDAVRIAERMDRDWLVTGRMPSGICGACLLIAARMNGFRRTVREMIYIVKAGEATIEKRLKEFEQLESAQLSVRDFRATCLEKSAAPPSYAKSLKKQQQALKARKPVKRPNEGDEEAPQRKKRQRVNKKLPTIGGDVMVDGSRIHIDLDVPARSSSKRKRDTEDDDDDDDSQGEQDEEMLGAIENRMDAVLNREIRKATMKKGGEQSQADKENIPLEVDGKATNNKDNRNSSRGALVDEEDDDFYDAQEKQEDPEEDEFHDTQQQEEEEYSDIAGYMSLPDDVQKQVKMLARENVEQEKKAFVDGELGAEALAIRNEMESWMKDSSAVKAAESLEKERRNLGIAQNGSATSVPDDNDLSDVDDAEIDAMILTPEEVRTKTLIWYANNKEYLEKKAVERVVDGNRATKKRRVVQSATTPAEAVKKLMDNKTISKKIRPDVLDEMFESAESIERIKEADRQRKEQADTLDGYPPSYEVVEESGDVPPAETENSYNNGQDNEDADEDEETDLEDLADDERLMREARARYYYNDNDDEFGYEDDDDDDGFGD